MRTKYIPLTIHYEPDDLFFSNAAYLQNALWTGRPASPEHPFFHVLFMFTLVSLLILTVITVIIVIIVTVISVITVSIVILILAVITGFAPPPSMMMVKWMMVITKLMMVMVMDGDDLSDLNTA